MMSTCKRGVAVSFACAAGGATAFGGLSQLLITAPGGYIQAGATDTAASLITTPGSDFEGGFTNEGSSDFDEASFAGFGLAQRGASFTNGTITNNGWGEARMGLIRFAASNTSLNSSPFPIGGAGGGWKESFQVSSPGLDGQAGFFTFFITANGTLHAAGFAGAAGVFANAYKDNVELSLIPLFDKGASDAISTDRQRVQWATSTFASGTTSDRTINDVVTFAVPIVFGQPFTLGVYGSARAGLRSQSAVAGNSTGTLDFTGGLAWGGVAAVYHGGAPVGSYTIVSGTGVNWDAPVSTTPGDLNGDGVVDGADLGLLLGAWGPCPSGCLADLNGDGTVDGADLGLLLGNWG
jgi:hypothetical protein